MSLKWFHATLLRLALRSRGERHTNKEPWLIDIVILVAKVIIHRQTFFSTFKPKHRKAHT